VKEKIVDRNILSSIAAEEHSRGKRIISTSGCFDILHAGHVTYLKEAREKGDLLIVMLNSDSSVKGIKGDGRPIVPEGERAEVIAGLESVDYVCIFDEPTPCELITLIKPDIVVKGGDYRDKHIPEMDAAGAYGGKVEYVGLTEGCSSTNIIERIRRGEKP